MSVSLKGVSIGSLLAKSNLLVEAHALDVQMDGAVVEGFLFK
jgi:hypothetical protein